MIKFLLRLKKNFVQLVWIKTLIDATVISSSMGRAIEGAIFSFYAGIVTFLITVIKTGSLNNREATLRVLAGTFGTTMLGAILKAIRDHKITE